MTKTSLVSCDNFRSPSQHSESALAVVLGGAQAAVSGARAAVLGARAEQTSTCRTRAAAVPAVLSAVADASAASCYRACPSGGTPCVRVAPSRTKHAAALGTTSVVAVRVRIRAAHVRADRTQGACVGAGSRCAPGGHAVTGTCDDSRPCCASARRTCTQTRCRALTARYESPRRCIYNEAATRSILRLYFNYNRHQHLVYPDEPRLG